MAEKRTGPDTLEQRMKFIPRLWAPLLQLVGIGLAYLLFHGRKSEAVRVGFMTDWMPTLYQHISNFSFSYILYTGAGLFWLIMGMRLRRVAAAGLVLIAANLVYELFIPVLNTPDPVDAWFGIAGTLVGLLVLTPIAKFGLMPNPEWTGDTPPAA